MREGAVLEQEAGDIGGARGRENRLEDDQQRHREQRPRRPPHPRPERQRHQDQQRVDGQLAPDDERGQDIGLDHVQPDEDRRREQRRPRIGEGHQPAQREQQRRGDRAEVRNVVEHRDDPAPHDRRIHPQSPQHQRGERAERDIDHGDRGDIGRGRGDDLLDHPGGGQRALEAAAADDRALAHPGPAGEEEIDHQQREEQLDRGMRRRTGNQVEHRIGRLDAHRAAAVGGADGDVRRRSVDEFLEVRIEVEQGRERVGHALDPRRDQRHPVDRRKHDRGQSEHRDHQEDHHAQHRGELGRHPAPLEPFEHRHQRDGDHQRRGHRQEELRPRAQRERQGDDQPDPPDQRQRGEQPHPLEFEVLDIGFVRIVAGGGNGCIHGSDCNTPAPTRQPFAGQSGTVAQAVSFHSLVRSQRVTGC